MHKPNHTLSNDANTIYNLSIKYSGNSLKFTISSSNENGLSDKFVDNKTPIEYYAQIFDELKQANCIKSYSYSDILHDENGYFVIFNYIC